MSENTNPTGGARAPKSGFTMTPRAWVGLVIAAAAIAFIVQNRQDVDINLLMFTISAPQLNLLGLAPVELLTQGDESTGAAAGGYSYNVVKVAEGTELARFAIDSSDDTGSDMDLFVYRVVGPDPEQWDYYDMWYSASESADEMVTLAAPTPGYYLIESHVYSYTSPFQWDLTSALVELDGGVGDLAASPNPLPVTAGVETSFGLSWYGLSEGGYLGVVRYGNSAVRTVVSVDVP